MKMRHIPGAFVTGLTDFIFGNDNLGARNTNINFVVKGGLVGSVLRGFANISQYFSSTVRAHKKAIDMAFWVAFTAAAAVGVAGAVMIAFFPATLATVASFSLYGFSIAAIAGANAVTQVAVASGLAFSVTNVTGYAVAALNNAVIGLSSLFSSKKKPTAAPDPAPVSDSTTTLSQLGGSKQPQQQQQQQQQQKSQNNNNNLTDSNDDVNDDDDDNDNDSTAAMNA
ncbi:MAG: hypothetical protein ACHP6H_00260 [Legionellales bacterium]